MGQEGSTDSERNQVDLVEETRVFAVSPDGEFVPIEVLDDGGLRTALAAADGSRLTDALESQGLDAILVQENDPLDVSAAEVDVDIATQSLAQVATNLEQIGGQAQSAVDVASRIDSIFAALQSQAGDELRTRVFNTTGTQIDPATAALEGALKSEDTDEFVSRLAGADGLEVQEEALDTAVAATDVSILTYLARALNSQDLDEFITRVTNSSGTQIDPATAALEGALKSNDTDEFVARVAGADGLEVQEEQLDTVVNAADVGLLTYLARALQSVGQDELVSRLTDSTGAQVNPAVEEKQPAYFDEDILNHDLIGTGDFTIAETNIAGTGEIVFKVASQDSETFTATVEWTDGSGNVLYTQSPSEATNTTDANLTFNTASDHFQLTITDTSGAAQNIIDGTVNAH